jgi:hypothetical protein
MENYRRRRRPRYREIDRERFGLRNEPPPSPDHTAPLKQLVPGFLKVLKIEEGLWEQQLMEQWAELVGPQLAGRARPGKVERKVLMVYVTSSAWLQELNRFGRPQILKNLQAAFGADRVRDIRLVLDPDLRR